MKKILFLALISGFSFHGFAKTVRYSLVVEQKTMNLSGKKQVDFALTVNGGIPAPTLEFTEGDNAEITVINKIPTGEEVSVHWHGILLPPEEDGVPYVNTPPIFKDQSHTFKFKIRQSGTYWYHSHTMLQEQKGVYGALIIHPKKKAIPYDKDAVVVLSDWSDENADQIVKNLRKDGDYYLHKKKSVRSYFGALSMGGFKSQIGNEWQRMAGMDLSDVGYDAFLINGKRDSQLIAARPGEKVRLRIINAGASSYFYVAMGVPMQVIAADGVDIAPIATNEILIGMAETYDVLFTVPQHKNYELRATVQDVTGFASAWIGEGEKVPAPSKPAPNLYAGMDHGAHGEHSEHAEHGHHNEPIQTLTVDQVTALEPTTLPKEAKVHDLKLVLDGNMERYIWHINGKAIHEDRLILINKGEVVRFTFENKTMMHHPMHLHGHFFRVLNNSGEKSPLKHTVDVPPHGTRTIEFYANEPGQWMLHCHNLFHMKTGMARVVRYNDYKLTPEMEALDKHDPHLHQHLYHHSQLGVASNRVKTRHRIMRTWDELDIELEAKDTSKKGFSVSEKWDAEGDVLYRRWFSNFFHVFGGGTLYHEEFFGTAGLGYVLPFLIEASTSVNHEGRFRLDLERRFQWTSKVYSDVEFSWRPEWGGERDDELELTLMYSPSWAWAAGLVMTENNLGVGALVQF